MSLCQYKNIFGEPNVGAHSYRLFGIAIIDTVLTILAAILLAYFFKWNLVIVLVVLFLLGIIAHRVFCVRTQVDKWLFTE